MSAIPISPASFSSTATPTAVRPSSSSRAASASAPAASIPSAARWRALPTVTRCPSTVALTPWPTAASNSLGSAISAPVASARSTTARASGCSERDSAEAASASRRSSGIPNASRSVTRGSPRVRVPVLSRTTVSSPSAVSSASPPRTSTPSSAPRPVPTMIAVGVASPSAHGQAMIRTAIAASIASVKPEPPISQATKASAAIAITTGTK